MYFQLWEVIGVYLKGQEGGSDPAQQKKQSCSLAKAPSFFISIFTLSIIHISPPPAIFGSHMSAGHRELRSSLGDEELMEMSSPPPPHADC